MSDTTPPIGSVGWIDLTVDDADGLRDFYASVVGWTHSPVDMGGYSDYCVNHAGGEPVGGVCHARGGNTGLPAAWIIYWLVADLDSSLDAVRSGGGEVLGDVRSMGADRYAVVRDPAGAVCALYQKG